LRRLLAMPVLLVAAVLAQQTQHKVSAVPADWCRKPIVPGEKLTYAVRWKGIRAGTSTLEVAPKVRKYRGKECFLLMARTRSSDAISAVYEVNDIVKSLVERGSLQPLKASKRLKEGPHRARQLLFFYPDKRRIRYYRYKRNRYVLTRDHKNALFPTYDVLSVVFALRLKKLSVGKKYTIKVCTGKRICDAEFVVMERKRIRVEAGEFEAFRLGPRFKVGKGKLGAKEGLFVSEKIAEVWVDALTKRPILMRAKVPIGTAEVELVKYEFPKGDKNGR